MERVKINQNEFFHMCCQFDNFKALLDLYLKSTKNSQDYKMRNMLSDVTFIVDHVETLHALVMLLGVSPPKFVTNETASKIKNGFAELQDLFENSLESGTHVDDLESEEFRNSYKAFDAIFLLQYNIGQKASNLFEDFAIAA